MSTIIRVEDVWKRRKVRSDDGTERDENVLKGLSFSVTAGEIVVVVGPSGSGKSTLLKLLNGLRSPDAGSMFFEGEDITTIEPTELRRRVAMVFQSPAFVADTVRENLCYGPRLAGRAAEMNDEAMRALLEMVRLDETFLPRNPEELSQGEKQRVSIAMALSNRPAVMLMDEPTSALDQATASQIVDLVLELNRKLGLTFIIVTHVVEHADRLSGSRRIELRSDNGC